MDKELEKFLEELANNSPNASQFDNLEEDINMKEVEEDLIGGKSLKTFKDQIKGRKK